MHQSLTTRRAFISAMTAAFAGAAFGEVNRPSPTGVPLWQDELPYSFDALEPFMSGRVLRHHFEEVHSSYLTALQTVLQTEDITVGNVISLMPGMNQVVQPQRTDSLMPLGRLASLGMSYQPPQTLSAESVRVIREAGGGHVNHSVFWRFMCPPGSGPSGPNAKVTRAIEQDFGSFRAFRRLFKEVAMNHTGSGWAWLVYRPDGCLVVSTTKNEDNPMMKEHVPWEQAGRPILMLDLWEHSYCDQYGDDREKYIDAWWKVVNWQRTDRGYTLVTGKI